MVRKAQLVHKVPEESRVHRDHKGPGENRVLLGSLVQQAHQDPLVKEASLVSKDHRDQKVMLDQGET